MNAGLTSTYHSYSLSYTGERSQCKGFWFLLLRVWFEKRSNPKLPAEEKCTVWCSKMISMHRIQNMIPSSSNFSLAIQSQATSSLSLCWVHCCEPVCISFTLTYFHTIALNPGMCGLKCVCVCCLVGSVCVCV